MTKCSEHDLSKVCTKCQEEKSFSAFPKNSRYKCGYNPRCKICVYEHNRNWRLKNPEAFKESRRKTNVKNADAIKLRGEKYRKSTKSQKANYDLNYRKENKEAIKVHKRNWEDRNKNNPIHKIKRNLRRRVHHALKGESKSASTFELIGCTAEEFKLHIESLWSEGMSWDNYGPNGWHIDHIRPCFSFDLSDAEQQKACFHFSNQRPLWAKDNLRRPKDDSDIASKDYPN